MAQQAIERIAVVEGKKRSSPDVCDRHRQSLRGRKFNASVDGQGGFRLAIMAASIWRLQGLGHRPIERSTPWNLSRPACGHVNPR
jgi:hypothetical protein